MCSGSCVGDWSSWRYRYGERVRTRNTGIYSYSEIQSEREYTLYGGYNNGQLRGVADCFIKYKFNWRTEVQIMDDNTYSESRGKIKTSEAEDHEYHAIIVEAKPKLDSAGGTIRQLKIYQDCIAGVKQIRLVVITFDTNTKYDPLFEAEDIIMIRVPKDKL